MKKLVLLICIIFINLFFIGCNQFIDYSNEDIKELVVLKDDDLKDLADLQNEKFRSIVNDYENYIVDEIYFENSKIIGFSNNTNQGVLVYEKDIDGNYILNQTNTVDMNQNSLGVSHYRIIYENYNDAKNAKYGYLIISNGKNVSRVEITINDNNKYYGNLDVGNPSMILIKETLPVSELEAIRLEVKYFDENNNELLK